MATWIAHLRVAEKLLEKFPSLDTKAFLVGNIGPDSGVPNEDWSQFTPPKVISHWYDTDSKIDPEDFKSKYLSDMSGYSDIAKSFYIGYYVHLLCDVCWGIMLRKKLEEPLYKDNLEKDPKFIWVIKEDWYGHDHLYLRGSKDNVFHKEFMHIKEFPNTYFDFFPPEAFTRQINYITGYYLNFNENLDREFPYLSLEEMNTYVEDARKMSADALYNLLDA